HAALPAARARPPVEDAPRAPDRVPVRRRAVDTVAERPSRPPRRRDRAGAPVPEPPALQGAALPARRGGRRARRRRTDAPALLHGGDPLALPDRRRLRVDAPRDL